MLCQIICIYVCEYLVKVLFCVFLIVMLHNFSKEIYIFIRGHNVNGNTEQTEINLNKLTTD